MSVELGDQGLSGPSLTVTKPSDGTNLNGPGDAVTMNGSQQVTPTGDGDDFYGVVVGPADDSVDLTSLSSGDSVVVLVFGDVIVNAGGSVTEGDLLETTSTSGRLGQNGTGTERDFDEGGSATGTAAYSTALALSNSGGTAASGESLATNEAHVFVGR